MDIIPGARIQEASMTTPRNQEPEAPSGDHMVRIFKALADPARLRIAGLLAEESRCGQELAQATGLSPATVTHHLGVLRRAGLLREERRPPYTYLHLDFGELRRGLREMLGREKVRRFAAGPDMTRERSRVLNAFFDGPVLKAIPAQRRKKEIVFEEILRRLPRRTRYTERELSRMIGEIHPDFCTIRREFIMGGYMDRKDGIYRWAERGREAIGET
jgi:DNA-binding transcriptional ArsR family regulator